MPDLRAPHLPGQQPEALVLDRQPGRETVQLQEKGFGPKAALGVAVARKGQTGLNPAELIFVFIDLALDLLDGGRTGGWRGQCGWRGAGRAGQSGQENQTRKDSRNRAQPPIGSRPRLPSPVHLIPFASGDSGSP